MKKNIFCFAFLLIFIYGFYSNAQIIERCGIHIPVRTVATPQILAKTTSTTSNVNIPVVFHILYKDDGIGNISDAQVQVQLDSLNYGYRGSCFTFYLAAINRIKDDNLHFWASDPSTDYYRNSNKKFEISTTYDIDPI